MNLPGILDVEALVAARDLGVQPDAVLPRVVAVGAAHVDDRATRVALTPVDVETPLRVVGEDVVAHPVQRVAPLDRVVLAEHVSEVGGIEIHVVTREQVLLGRQCAGDVGVAGRSVYCVGTPVRPPLFELVLYTRYGTWSLP